MRMRLTRQRHRLDFSCHRSEEQRHRGDRNAKQRGRSGDSDVCVSPDPTYAITISDAAGAGLGNYIISYTPATLTISQAAVNGGGEQREQDLWGCPYV